MLPNLTPFQRKLLALLLLSVTAPGDPAMCCINPRFLPEVEGLAFVSTTVADGETWVSLSNVGPLIAQVFDLELDPLLAQLDMMLDYRADTSRLDIY